MIFQYHIARITPSAAVYGRARCITFELFSTCSLDVHYMGITTTNPFFKCRYVAMKFFYSEFLAAGSHNQLPAPLGRNLADA
jgi:hypothetical protein